MSTAAAHAAEFYREVAQSKTVWTIRDSGGFPAPRNSDGVRAQPFWSSRSRAMRIIEHMPAYAGFQPVEIDWATFVERWVPGLTRDKILCGVNWSGDRATGFDVRPSELKASVLQQMA